MKLASIRSLVAVAVIGVSLSGIMAESAPAEELIGARALIGKVMAGWKSSGDDKTSEAKARDKFQADALDYMSQVTSLTPEEAGDRWLHLVNRLYALSGPGRPGIHSIGMGGDYENIGMDLLAMYLPSPDAWPLISKRLETTTSTDALRLHGLQLLFARLQEDASGTKKALDRVKTDLKANGSDYHSSGLNLDEVLATLPGNENARTASIGDRFRHMLELREKHTENNAKIQVPDLVLLVGADEAKVLLEKAISLPKTTLELPASGATVELAQQIALERVDQLTEPRWDLVQTLGSEKLYDAMKKRFPDSDNKAKGMNADPVVVSSIASAFGMMTQDLTGYDHSDPSTQDTADVVHVLDKINNGKISEAKDAFKFDKEFLGRLSYTSDQLISQVPPAPLYELLIEELKRNNYTCGDADTDGRVYGQLHELARRLQRVEDFIAFSDMAINSKVKPAVKAEINSVVANALLEINKPEDAVERLKSIALMSDIDDPDSSNNPRFAAAMKIAKLGRLLNKHQWENDGVADANRILNEIMSDAAGSKERGMEDWMIASMADDLTALYIRYERFAEAEKLVLRYMEFRIDKEPADQAASLDFTEQLCSLVSIYGAQNRYDDVIEVLEITPLWSHGVTDVKDLLTRRYNQCDDKSVVPMARAFVSRNQKESAVRLLKTALVQKPNADLIYDELTTMTGAQLIPWLDKLYATDRFEERPLMWKAILLERAGKLDEAEKTARKAIKVDPTDGEQPVGQRIRSYGVLAGILEKNNQADEAKKLRQVVESVRLAERGDAFNEIGLAHQAIDEYTKASTLFSDAYCVEWRLARRLQEAGDTTGSQEHYEKAFTMMPQQFGQMANLCFGCENIFAEQQPQSIAERILIEMTKKTPVNPTVLYLLGMLRKQQLRYTEAAEFYRKAIAIDPDYYDALEELYEIKGRALIGPAEQRQIAEKLVSMDPYMKHFTESSMLSPATIWKAGARSENTGLVPDEPIWPMPANKRRMEEKIGPEETQLENMMKMQELREKAPGRLIHDQQWFRYVSELLTPNPSWI